MLALRRILPFAPLLLLVLALPAAPPEKDEIAKLVKQLGDNDFETREAASRKLGEAGEIAEEALKEAAKGKDPEVSRRATEILEKFKWGLYPDTPKNVVELVESYRSADANIKAGIITKLFDAGTSGCKALLKIARAEPDAAVRASLIVQIYNELPRAVPMLLEDNSRGILEQLVEMGIENQVRTGIAHYTAYWLLSGKIDERIAHFKAAEKTSADPKREAEILAYLYRARGDLPSSLEAARRADVDDLTDSLLAEMGDWKQLAERKAVGVEGERYERLGYRAAYYRLAGQKKELDETLATLVKEVEIPSLDDLKIMNVAKVLLLNGRTAEALKVLSSGENKLTTFEILCARSQFDDAFDLVDKARFTDSKEAPVLEIAQARVLSLLGEKKKSAAIFAKYGALIKEGTDASWSENLIEAEVRSGFMDEAFEHTAKVLALAKDRDWAPQLLGKLYPSKKLTAEHLWTVVGHLSEKEDVVVKMKRLHALLDGKAPVKEVKTFLDDAEKVVEAIALVPLNIRSIGTKDAKTLNLALGEVALAAKMEDRADALFKKAGSSEGWLRVGDLLAQKNEWKKAEEAYHKAWEADRASPLPLWLAGWAAQHKGKKAAGKKLMEQAHWLPLGAEATRHQFALELLKRNHAEESRREDDLIVKTGKPGSYHTGEAIRRFAIAAMMRHDYAAAVEGNEKAMLRVLKPYINFVQKQAYVLVPGAIHKLRAAALLKAGKVPEALAEARVCLEIIPGHVDVPILLLPDLEKRGMKKEADDLFAESLKVHAKLCRDYPNSAFAHNSVAWLRVCCRRDLDNALEHALKATQLAPTNPGHLDTLAEVYFQRGEQAKAIEVQKKVVALDPKRVYFRKQLKRIEAGDPKVERPPEEDDEDDDD